MREAIHIVRLINSSVLTSLRWHSGFLIAQLLADLDSVCSSWGVPLTYEMNIHNAYLLLNNANFMLPF